MRQLFASVIVFWLLNSGTALATPFVTGTYEPNSEGYLVKFVVYNGISGYADAGRFPQMTQEL